MAWLFVLCALIGVTLANPTPQTLPKSILGTWENIPSKSKNFEEFITVFGFPIQARFDRYNFIEFWKDGDTYYQRFAYWPITLTFDLPFKLGETHATTILGKHFEYVYSLESGAIPNVTVLRTKFHDADSDVRFTIETVFEKDRIHSTFARENVVAKRSYRRTLPPYVFGYFESDETAVTDEAVKFLNSIRKLPAGVKLSKNMTFWLGRDDLTDKFVHKIIPDPTYYFKIEFDLDKPVTVDYMGERYTDTYSVLESNATSVTLRHESISSKGTVIFTTVFNQTEVRSTIKAGEKEFFIRYRRTISPSTYGTFMEVPGNTRNWEEFMKGGEGCKVAEAMKKFTVYRKNIEEYGVQKVLNRTRIVDVVYKLDTPMEVTLPNGKVLQINATMISGNETVMIVRTQNGLFEKKILPGGVAVTYRRKDVEAAKYYRRVLPPVIFGTFEAAEMTDADFVEFATKHHMAQFLKKATFELAETSDHKLTKKYIWDAETKEITFALGEPFEYKTPDGQSGMGKVFFFVLNDKPYLRDVYFTGNKQVFQVVSEYSPNGFNATYVYGDQTHGGEKIVKRTYTRKGDPVPFEPVPTKH